MTAVVLQATVFAAALLVVEPASYFCKQIQGCSCSYADSYARVACHSLPDLRELPPLTRSLDLSRKDVATLAGGLFSSLAVLEELLLSWNRMSSISEHALLNLTNLRVLDLSHNLLTSLPRGLLDSAPRLQKLDMSFNRLAALDVGTFQNVQNLDELSLAYNDQLGPFLETATEVMSAAFKNDLRSLSLDHVNIRYLPDNFFVEAESLRELFLADNPLQAIPFLPGGLETLDMSGCMLRELIPGAFVTLPFLRVLTLDRMPELVEVQQNAFEGLTALDELSLQNCLKLNAVSASAFGDLGPQRCAVRRLSVARGGLRGLPEELAGPLAKLDHLELAGNPWHCDCHLAWLRTLNLTAAETSSIRCVGPPDLRNALVWSLPDAAFRCTGHRQRRNLAAAAGAALLLAAATVAGVLLWRRFLRRRRAGGWAPRAPGVYELLHMDAATQDEEAEGVWSTETSRR